MRNKRLDVLRCIAVFLVIIRHGGGKWPLLANIGWVGVDLFFVLSGFLISGLLFSEYKTHRSISFKRFFIRRSLKIYPAFYFFLFLTWLISYTILHSVAPWSRYIHEILFVQNYWEGVWGYCWSLGVEEHFYILLPALLLFLAKTSSDLWNPFRFLPHVFVFVALSCIALRAASVFSGTPDYYTAYSASHNRIDALFFGALLGYFYHFHGQALNDLVHPTTNRVLIAVCSAALLSTTYFLPRESKLFSTFGYSCVYLGLGGLLVLSLYLQGILRGKIARIAEVIGTVAASVGTYSYSIYLWHGPTGAWLPGLVRRVVHVPFSDGERHAVYLIGSPIIGIMMSKIIEYPILRFRDRILPAPHGIVVRSSGTCAPRGKT
jgi:peptidoglycan/LPS O-acetylase OafA/YrhL